jgi:hypothetical protein
MIRFQKQNLGPRPEPLMFDELELGSVYFSVTFSDKENLLPTMEPLVFIGNDLCRGDTGKIYLQDWQSYQRNVAYGEASATDSDTDSAYFFSAPMTEVDYLFDYDHALEELMRCSLRRRLVGASQAAGTVLSNHLLHFEERELNQDPEPLSAALLREESAYFSVNFVDRAMLYPALEALIYIGRDLDNVDYDELYFQDADSYVKGARYQVTKAPHKARILLESAKQPWVFDYERALDLLMACSLRRRGGARERVP